jgi:hypothetical protein
MLRAALAVGNSEQTAQILTELRLIVKGSFAQTSA